MRSLQFATLILWIFPLLGAGEAPPVSEQIMVDQLGFRPKSDKIVIFASPQEGQNAATKYQPPAKASVRRLDNGTDVLSVDLKAWNGGNTEKVSGDKVCYADISALRDPGTYYLYDAENKVRSYNFRVGKDVYAQTLKAAVRMYFYQRCGGDVPQANGGTWHHPPCHCAENQDKAAQLYIDGQAKGQPRDVHGGWHDAGDYNKYVPFTAEVIPCLLMAYEFNPKAFGDDWNIPESGNGVPDLLDEVKWECDWLLRMQLPDGSVCNRVTETTSKSGVTPDQDNQHARYYTQPTSWATAVFAANLANFSRVISKFPAEAAYAKTCRAAAEKAWAWLEAHPDMTPADGVDHGRPSEAADAACDNGKDGDTARRVMAALQLWMLDPQPKYEAVFKKWHADMLALSFIQYALTPKADPAIVAEVKAAVKKFADERVGNLKSNGDAYRAYLPDYWWGCNQSKAEYAYRALFAAKLNVDAANTSAYRACAEEYIHYFHGRNPLCFVYLTNMGAKGANLGVGKCSMSPFHTWFAYKSQWDGPDSLGPAPGYLVGGPNRFDAPKWLIPPAGQPPEKAYKDWNKGWNDEHHENENSWSFTEPAIYYQARYILLLAQFVGMDE
jgi:endoglucanase